MKVSALILTYNEERNIAACLESLDGIEDIVVVDSGSTDRTCEIAARFGARVLSRPFDDFANQRNFGLDEGGFREDWVLHLDADEVATPAFLAALAALQPTDGIDGYRVPSKTMLRGQWLQRSGMYPTYQVRLGRRDALRFVQVGHGQREDLPPERVGTFPEPYLHYNFSHGLTQWLRKHVAYAQAEAAQLFTDRQIPLEPRDIFDGDATRRRRALKRLVNRLPVVVRPPLRFVHAWIVRRGFLDGPAGLQYAVMLACYEAMIAAQVLDLKAAAGARN
ncbi:glycosyltransferase [Erythrobacter arachoides]|uniref:Glycosyltransferase n=1 Tax=Aurantiacibacter arachoides TaxID=1850444 RepID=A0A844ZZP8_9SPHN|nr:glycosyltransferase family 2 protein [Aurantiacibacter arachoides]MXO93375.1 glycosyltransferase [Aurantiacibacter arachoides]GGD49876.1 beta 1,4 glucosyltransferase [Aurantiacibacter arachoides]